MTSVPRVTTRVTRTTRVTQLTQIKRVTTDQDDQDDMNDEALFHCAVYGVTNDLYCAFFLFLQMNISFV